MIKKYINYFHLWLIIVLINRPIICMEKRDLQEGQTETQNIIPNEILLLIFQYKIHNIIESHDLIQAKKEFKMFLSSLRLAGKRSYEFTDELKKYFVQHQQQVSNVSITIDEQAGEYKLSFKFKKNSKEYDFILDSTNNILVTQFTADIVKISNPMLQEIGAAILLQIRTIDTEDIDKKIGQVLNYIMLKIYQAADNDGKDKIRILVQTLLNEFTKKYSTEYKSFIEEYHIKPKLAFVPERTAFVLLSKKNYFTKPHHIAVIKQLKYEHNIVPYYDIQSVVNWLIKKQNYYSVVLEAYRASLDCGNAEVYLEDDLPTNFS